MNEKQMNEKLLEAFPELREDFDRYVSWQDGIGTGAFLTYEDVFRPRIETAIKDCDKDFLKRSAEFIEELYLTRDKYATNVIYVGILEGLKANCDNEAVRAFLKPETREEFDSLVY